MKTQTITLHNINYIIITIIVREKDNRMGIKRHHNYLVQYFKIYN